MSHTLPEPLSHNFTPADVPQTTDVVEPIYDALEGLEVDTPDGLKNYLTAWNEVT